VPTAKIGSMVPDSSFGQLCALASALSFAFASIAISSNKRRGLSNDGAFLSVIMTVLFSFALFLVFEDGDLPSLDDPKLLEGILWFCMAGLFAMVFGRTLVFRSIGLLGVTRGTTVKKLNPFFSILLAVIILGESLIWEETIGVFALALAIFLLISDKTRKYEHEAENTPKDWIVVAPLYLPGILSCLAYAVSYIARKNGLITLGTPAFGTFVSAMAGVCFYLILAVPSESYRRFVVEGVRNITPTTLAIGASMSIGQVLFFTALTYEELSTVVMIGSLETFIAMFLSVVIFRLEIRPSMKQLGAAVLASTGVSLVTFY
jgi:drug/metabolite transporter (DMT)-like permease